MKFVEEIVVDEFLPTFRSMLAEDLRDRGFTQSEVAEALGISQSAVSKYAHGDMSQNEEILEDERVRDLVDRIGEGFEPGDMTPVQALVEAEVLVRQLEEGDLLAALHEKAMPGLSEFEGSLSVHDPDSALRRAEQVRSSVRRGLRILTNTPGFAGLIPNVGSNLVECLPDATTIEDVAGVPGRIFGVKGQATVPGDPEFGVSEHVASVLLSARAADVDYRATLNVRYDPDVVAALSEAGYETVEFDSEARGDPIADAVAGRTFEGDDGEPRPFVLYQTGGYGIEPITYVVAPDASAAATVIRRTFGRR